MNTTTVRLEIAAFAADVRAQIDDLPADTVDDLLDGLEADLNDQADEAGDAFTLPDPVAYAAELRAAAGLGERPARSARRRVRTVVSARVSRAVAAVRAHPFGGWLLDTLNALRPVWWIIRAIVLALLLVPFVGMSRPTGMDLVDRALNFTSNVGATVLLGALLLLSVQWGRGAWAPTRWLRIGRNVVNVVTAVIAPFLLVGLFTSAQTAFIYPMTAQTYTSTPGLTLDGERVRNIFAYDAQGEPLDHVQLFDQNGSPLTTVGRSGAQDEWDYYFYGGGGPAPVGESVAGRLPVWNVFPLREAAGSWDNLVEPEDATAPPYPFATVPPLPTSIVPETGTTDAAADSLAETPTP